ncbi:hypothetical protein [Paenibacillus alginolyticus]|uniref:hypothetical protein n=1 Tax=Paenibacillus alginolyticus TaxID=59839 RepID=UPI002DB6D85A|nr:hypothetical protein [Paenibacillus alginolyticus]MEC0148665.1 hypothetical protein [Paenibacillus alginolyticus]
MIIFFSMQTDFGAVAELTNRAHAIVLIMRILEWLTNRSLVTLAKKHDLGLSFLQ